jgi:hypothetical protein
MGKIVIDFDKFLDPLRWGVQKSKTTGMLGRLILLFGGIGYFFSLVVFLLIVLPIIWLYEKLI